MYMKTHPLNQLLSFKSEHKHVGIYSACTANPICIEAVLENAKETKSLCLIESTANQVNQFGGYTGLTPEDFAKFVYRIGNKTGIDSNQIILGGDHLGPLTWTNVNSNTAMENAKKLIETYVLAGYTKIHIDTSMRLQDDASKLDNNLIVQRSIELAKTVQKAYEKLHSKNPNTLFPVLVVGSEVPIPGGAQSRDNQMHITTPSDLIDTIQAYESGFISNGLDDLWQQVIAIVAQPGVEEADLMPVEYNHKMAQPLMKAIQSYPNLVMEGHSTDYQTKTKLRQMVKDGVGILKVGPALTFALREGLFALSFMEDILYQNSPTKSHFRHRLEEAMVSQPRYWVSHYHGNESDLYIKRQYSFSDRCRYYLPQETIDDAIKKLCTNIDNIKIPMSVLSQFMPLQYQRVRDGLLDLNSMSLLKDHIKDVIRDYTYATQQEKMTIPADRNL